MSGNDDNKTPPKCNQAVKRLEHAISRLERAVQNQGKAAASGADSRVAMLESELDQMRKLTQTVTERLDKSIGRIRIALEN